MELRRLRDERGMTIDRAARTIWRSTGWLSGVENGYGICGDDFEEVLDRYGAEDPSYRAALVEFARVDRKRGWWHRHIHDLAPAAMDFISLESDSRSARTYEGLAVPGLLQTPAYANAMITLDPEARRRAVEIRMARQRIFNDPVTPDYDVLLNEAVLHQSLGGPEVVRGQLGRLLKTPERPGSNLRIVPFNPGNPHGLMGAFTLLVVGQAYRLTVGMVESPVGMTYVEHLNEVRRLEERFEKLRESALSSQDSLALIEQIRSKA
ncbi:helix-turn-helix domain-containing protein [Spirillospora sp. NPDC050679]